MKKIIIISIAAVVILGAGFFFYLKKNKLSDFEPLIREKLQTLVMEASDSLYHLEFDNLDADVVASKLAINNVRLIPDSLVADRLDSNGKRPADIFELSLKTIVIDGINIDDFLSNKKIDLEILYLNEPVVKILHKKPPGEIDKDTATLHTVYQRISEKMNRISVKRIAIKNMNVLHHNYTDKNNEPGVLKFNNVNMVFDDILIDSVTQYDSTRFLYARNASISLERLQLRTEDSLYFLNLDSISVNVPQKRLHAAHLGVQPRYSKESFVKQISHIKERYDINLDNISFSNIDWWSIVSNESFESKEAVIERAKLEIYTDRSLPPNPKSKLGNYPHQLIMKVPLLVNIESIRILNSSIEYTEFNPKSGKTGTIFFTDINGTITNITNDSSVIAINPLLQIDAKGKLMRSGALTGKFGFNLNRSEEGAFSVDVRLGAIDATVLNPVTEPLGIFSVEKLNIKSLSAHIDGTNYRGKGNIQFLYNDLKVDILKKGNTGGEQQKQGLVSFIANALVLKHSNNSGTQYAVYERDIHKSFFNLIWKTILIGILKTIGYDMGAEKVR